MHTFATSLLLASTAAAAAAKHPSKQVDIRPRATTSYLTQMADTWIARGIVKDFDYATNVLYMGYEKAIELTQNETYSSWYE